MLTVTPPVRDMFPCVRVCVCLSLSQGWVTYTGNAQLKETSLNLLTARLLTYPLDQFCFSKQSMRCPLFHPIANT